MIEPATMARRLAAQLIDLLVLLALWSAAGWAVFAVLPGMAGAFPLLCAVVILTYLYEVRLATDGRTPGKRLLGLGVVLLDGRPVDRGLLTRRLAVAYVLAAVFPPWSTLAALTWPFFDRTRRQGLHDKVAGTMVVSRHGGMAADPGGAPRVGVAATSSAEAGLPGWLQGRGALGSWPLRVTAMAIDLSPFIGAYALERAVVAAIGSGSRWIGVIAEYLALGWLIYNQYRAGVTGQSLGKRVVGLRLVRQDDGTPLGGGMAIVRYLLHVIDGALVIGFLWPSWDAKRQTFADKIMRSLVTKVQDGSSRSSAGTDQHPPSTRAVSRSSSRPTLAEGSAAAADLDGPSSS